MTENSGYGAAASPAADFPPRVLDVLELLRSCWS
jgi:hypothetical protein